MSLRLIFMLLLCAVIARPAAGAATAEDRAQQIIGDPARSQGMILDSHNGISLIGLTVPNGETFDVPIMATEEALKVIKDSLALIESRSAFSRRQIDRLRERGPVVVVYDPLYPKRMANMASVQVALFSPNFFKTSKHYEKNGFFLVIVSRHGVKWPLEELAAVMVHELVGHGIQHLNDRWTDMRLIDMECEAWLYEEMAYQNLGLDKFSNPMIDFKRQLAKQCGGFLRHLRKKDPEGLALWETLNPDVPALLKHFAAYLKTL